METAEDGMVWNNLIIRAEHQLLGGVRQNRPRHTAKSMEEGIDVIVRTTSHEAVKRVVMWDGDPAMILTEFEDMVVTENSLHACVCTGRFNHSLNHRQPRSHMHIQQPGNQQTAHAY